MAMNFSVEYFDYAGIMDWKTNFIRKRKRLK